MKRQRFNGALPHDPDADRLSAAWNEITAGRTPSYEEGPADLIAAAELLHAEAPEPRPNPSFKHQLRESLMQTAMPAARPATTLPAHLRDKVVTRPSETGIEPSAPHAASRGATRWIAIAATLLLLATTAFGAYLGLYRPSNEPSGTDTAMQGTGTPEAGGTMTSDRFCPFGFYPPCEWNPVVGVALIVQANFPAEALAVSKVQMQRWELEGLDSVQYGQPGPGETLNPPPGISIDFVVEGAYQATFSGPVVVSRATEGLPSDFEYPGEGELIELGQGDSVTYQTGAKMEVRNPMESKLLHFKSILIFDGDGTDINLGANGTFLERVEADGVLPMPLNEYPNPGYADPSQISFNVTLSYVTVQPCCSFPPPPPDKPGHTTYVLGPAGGPEQPRGVDAEGFVVWISMPLG